MDEMNDSTTQATNDEYKNKKLEKSLLYKLREITSYLIIFAVCFVSITFTFNFVLKPLQITGGSMQPTINNSFTDFNKKYDYVYYYSSGNYNTGDIVIIDNDNNETLIKRVVALAGEKVTISKISGSEVIDEETNSIVKVEVKITVTNSNSQTTELKNYKDEQTYFYFITEYNEHIFNNYESYIEINDALKNNSSYSITIPENHVYCLGDNRNNSTDSRHYGSFKISQIMGEVIIHIPYGKSIFYGIWHKIFG